MCGDMQKSYIMCALASLLRTRASSGLKRRSVEFSFEFSFVFPESFLHVHAHDTGQGDGAVWLCVCKHIVCVCDCLRDTGQGDGTVHVDGGTGPAALGVG